VMNDLRDPKATMTLIDRNTGMGARKSRTISDPLLTAAIRDLRDSVEKLELKASVTVSQPQPLPPPPPVVIPAPTITFPEIKMPEIVFPDFKMPEIRLTWPAAVFAMINVVGFALIYSADYLIKNW